MGTKYYRVWEWKERSPVLGESKTGVHVLQVLTLAQILVCTFKKGSNEGNQMREKGAILCPLIKEGSQCSFESE